MKERPILFSAPMVRAILDGKKSQTRRIVKHAAVPWNPAHTAWEITKCPYGQPGDRLYVKEQHEFIYLRGGVGCLYKADMEERMVVAPYTPKLSRGRPSIHMPRWASRILLEITAVRVEQLQDISFEDAIAEGIYHYAAELARDPKVSKADIDAIIERHGAGRPQCLYAHLWEQINGAGSWAANPWVWVIEFRRIVT